MPAIGFDDPRMRHRNRTTFGYQRYRNVENIRLERLAGRGRWSNDRRRGDGSDAEFSEDPGGKACHERTSVNQRTYMNGIGNRELVFRQEFPSSTADVHK